MLKSFVKSVASYKNYQETLNKHIYFSWVNYQQIYRSLHWKDRPMADNIGTVSCWNYF